VFYQLPLASQGVPSLLPSLIIGIENRTTFQPVTTPLMFAH